VNIQRPAGTLTPPQHLIAVRTSPAFARIHPAQFVLSPLESALPRFTQRFTQTQFITPIESAPIFHFPQCWDKNASVNPASTILTKTPTRNSCRMSTSEHLPVVPARDNRSTVLVSITYVDNACNHWCAFTHSNPAKCAAVLASRFEEEIASHSSASENLPVQKCVAEFSRGIELRRQFDKVRRLHGQSEPWWTLELGSTASNGAQHAAPLQKRDPSHKQKLGRPEGRPPFKWLSWTDGTRKRC
jgi:hypothetical protein